MNKEDGARLVVWVGLAWAKTEGRAEGIPDGGNSKCKDKEVGSTKMCLGVWELSWAAGASGGSQKGGCRQGGSHVLKRPRAVPRSLCFCALGKCCSK